MPRGDAPRTLTMRELTDLEDAAIRRAQALLSSSPTRRFDWRLWLDRVAIQLVGVLFVTVGCCALIRATGSYPFKTVIIGASGLTLTGLIGLAVLLGLRSPARSHAWRICWTAVTYAGLLPAIAVLTYFFVLGLEPWLR